MSLPQRLRTAFKIAVGRYPVLLIKVKPAAMLSPRGGDYVFIPVLECLAPYASGIEHRATRIQSRATTVAAALGDCENGFFTQGDALALYSLIQELRPAQIVEIGSGYSTRLM